MLDQTQIELFEMAKIFMAPYYELFVSSKNLGTNLAKFFIEKIKNAVPSLFQQSKDESMIEQTLQYILENQNKSDFTFLQNSQKSLLGTL